MINSVLFYIINNNKKIKMKKSDVFSLPDNTFRLSNMTIDDLLKDSDYSGKKPRDIGKELE